MKHPNRLPFEGVLTRLDLPSDSAPSGARGHRVLLTRAAAEEALPTLLGMAVGFTADLDGHNPRQKCGVIESAFIVADEVRVRGYLFAHDFPEVRDALSDPARELGMSYEMVECHVADMRAEVWTLTKVTFTGAAILLRDKAAYKSTRVSLSASSERFNGRLTFEVEGPLVVGESKAV